jgi:hypothetical protein
VTDGVLADTEPTTGSRERIDTATASATWLVVAMLRIRRTDPDLAGDGFDWLPPVQDALAFGRGESFVSVANVSTVPIELPFGSSVLLASAELLGGPLPPDTTAWLRSAHSVVIDQTSRQTAQGGE